jgi:alkanesulfonate monooxygenase SsuD/methylene tetrahydromethanopterin reductase-like flavin-dependent oxidoreductase (luciferase family)
VEIAAEYATGWLPPWIAPDQYPARIKELRDLAREKGRGDVDYEIATEVYVCVGKTDADALGFAQKTLGVLSEGFAEDATPQAIADSGLIGSTKTVREKLETYIAAGVSHYEMKFVYRDIPHFLEQLKAFAGEIAPAFAR